MNLYLLKSWNLYESISNSISIFPSLELWRDSGKLKMKQLIANLGISLDDAKQGFRFLKPEDKKQLKTKFISACHKMKLPDIIFDSFTYQIDYKYQFDAFDICNIMNGILNNAKNLDDAALKMEIGNDSKPTDDLFNFEENFWATFLKVLERFFHQEC